MNFKNIFKNKKDNLSIWNINLNDYNKKYSDPYGSKKNNGKNNMILSQNTRLNMDSYKTGRNNNIFCFGDCGTRFVHRFIIPNILQANCSFIIADFGGFCLSETGDFLKEQGYKIKVLDLVETVQGNHYNPFYYIRNEEDIERLVNCIILNTSNEEKDKNLFLEKYEIILLQTLILYLIKCKPKEEQNFKSVLNLLSFMKENKNNINFETLFNEILKRNEKDKTQSNIMKQYRTYKQTQYDEKVFKNTIVSLMNRLNIFNKEDVINLTQEDDIGLEKIGDEKTALFILHSVTNYDYNFIGSMMYNQLFDTLYYHAENECYNYKLPYHVRFILDTFDDVGKIPKFEVKLATMGKYNISCSMHFFSLFELKSKYKDEWQGIIGNCDTLLFFCSTDDETCQYVIDIINFGKKHNVISLNEIRNMNNDYCIIKIRGSNAFKDRKFVLEEHINYKYTKDGVLSHK